MGRFWKAAAANLALNLAISGIAVAAPLRDIASFWARPYIETLAERQFVEGFPDGTFRPDAPITRAQFAAMALKAFDLPGGGERPDFRDVGRNYWAASAIAAVSKSGLVAGFPDGTFHPEENITRAQALVILSRVLGTNRPDAAATLQRYADAQEVPEWARSAIATAADAGILVNYPDSTVIEPNSLATRGAVAALFYQTLARSGQSLPPLSIGTLAPNAPANPEDRTSQPSQPPASNVAARNDQLAIERIVVVPAVRSFRFGDELLVRVFATPGAQASFSIQGVAQAIPLQEVGSGVYEGNYTVRREDQGNNARIAVSLQNQTGGSVTRTAEGTYTFVSVLNR